MEIGNVSFSNASVTNGAVSFLLSAPPEDTAPPEDIAPPGDTAPPGVIVSFGFSASNAKRTRFAFVVKCRFRPVSDLKPFNGL